MNNVRTIVKLLVVLTMLVVVAGCATPKYRDLSTGRTYTAVLGSIRSSGLTGAVMFTDQGTGRTVVLNRYEQWYEKRE